MSRRRIDISAEIRDFATVYSTISEALRKNGMIKQVSPLDIVRRGAAMGSPGLSGLPHVQGDPLGPKGGSMLFPSGGSKQGSYNDTHKAAMDILTSRGVKPEVAAGAVGSMMGESGNALDPTKYNPNDMGSPSGGLAQWHKDRFNNLVAGSGMAPNQVVQNGKFMVPLDQQLKFLGHELDTSENGTLKKLQQASTLQQGNAIWTKNFERPANADAQVAKRLQYGQGLWDWAQNNQASPVQNAGAAPTQVAQALPTDNVPLPPERPAAPLPPQRPDSLNPAVPLPPQRPDGLAYSPQQQAIPNPSQSFNDYLQQQSNPASAVTQGVDFTGKPADQNPVIPQPAGQPQVAQGDMDMPPQLPNQTGGDSASNEGNQSGGQEVASMDELPMPEDTSTAEDAALPEDVSVGDGGGFFGDILGGLIDAFESGGAVGQRPDRVANPIPGIAALPQDVGTRPGGARTAMRAISPGYAGGGKALPMRHSYGPRYNPQSGKMDSDQLKSIGFYGPIKNRNGDIVSEYSFSVPIKGKETEIPSLVPGLSQQQIQSVLRASENNTPVPPDVADIAYEHAMQRIKAGQSPYWDQSVDEYPQYNPDQEWEAPSYADGGLIEDDQTGDDQTGDYTTQEAALEQPQEPAALAAPQEAIAPSAPQALPTADVPLPSERPADLTPAPTHAPAPARQAPQQGPAGFLDGIGDTLDGALKFISEAFGFQSAQAAPAGPTAMPQQQSPAILQGLQRLFSGEDAASSTEYNTVLNTVDPDKALDNGLRQAAGLNAVYHYWLERGEAGKAKATAASLIMHMQGLSQQFGDRAIKYMQQGKSKEAIQELQRGYEMIPDGNSINAEAHPDGSATVTQKNPDGQVINQFRASPQQLLAAALGLKNGTGYYQMLMEAAGKYKPAQQKQPLPPSQAFQQWQQGALPQPGAAAQAPAPAQAHAPAQAPAQQALPSAAHGVTLGGDLPQQALPPMPQLQLPPPPAPPDMNLVRQMQPSEQQFVLRQHQAELRDYNASVAQQKAEFAAQQRAIMAQRTAVMQENNANLRQVQAQRHEAAVEKQKLEAPFSLGDRHSANMDIASSIEQFKAAMPEGQTLSKSDERAIGAAANHVYMNRRNTVSADEAVDAVVDLADPNNKALDEAKPTENGLTQVNLRNGTGLLLDPQAIGAIKAIRDRKAQALKQQDYDKRNALGPRAMRAVGTMAEEGLPMAVNGLKSVGNSVMRAATPRNPMTPAGELMKSLWQQYQQATGK